MQVQHNIPDNIMHRLYTGCHDNGYATTLRSHITAGFKHKLILLQSYNEMAAGIAELELPSLCVPELFIAEKIVAPPFGSNGNSNYQASSDPAPASKSVAPFVPSGSDPTMAVPGNLDDQVPREMKRSSPSYSSALQLVQTRIPTPELDSSSSTESSDNNDPPTSNPRASFTYTRGRYINPNIVERFSPFPVSPF